MRRVYPFILAIAIGIICFVIASAVTDMNAMNGMNDMNDMQIQLPAGYDIDTEKRFPVLYLLPEDGISSDESDMEDLLVYCMDSKKGMEMIIVKPSFSEREAIPERMNEIVAYVEKNYRTVPEKDNRIVLGTGTGGYLAYTLLLEEDSPFGAAVSIRGDFASEENPWLRVYGSVYEKMENLYRDDKKAFDKVYMYMDAPVDDSWTDMPGSTDDLGMLMIGYGTGSKHHEFTVRPGPYDETFAAESVSRVMDRLTKRIQPDFIEEQNDQPDYVASETVIEGDYQQIDLMGDWYFQYIGEGNPLDMASLGPSEFETWSVVRPGFAWWTKGFGNINDDTVHANAAPDYFDYMITGNAYYAKTFDVPENFDAQDLVLAVGYVDDRCEAYVNGIRAGSTGLDERGNSTGETTWSEFSYYILDPSILNIGGKNTVIVRAYNDMPYGAGGWYSGPIGLYSRTAFDAQYGEDRNPRFYEESYSSAYAAKAEGKDGPEEMQYLIYLPEGYEDSDRFYPTLYLLHQFNSDHTSYRTDHVDELLDEGIREGLFDEMIVVIPNSSGQSWWAGDWQRMITEELIPVIESKYRVIQDARYRFTAGCSMGGQGAFSVALHNPDVFTGAASFFGAFSYGAASNPVVIADSESEEFWNNYALYFICGNQDSYGFGKPAIELHRKLDRLGTEHAFFIENGGHDSAFYVPYFQDALGYVRQHMYQSEEAIETLFSGSYEREGNSIHVRLTADPEIENYLYTAPNSSYTRQDTQPLHVPIIVEIMRDGEVVERYVNRDAELSSDQLTEEVDFSLNALDDEDLNVVMKAAVFDRTMILTGLEVCTQKREQP